MRLGVCNRPRHGLWALGTAWLLLIPVTAWAQETPAGRPQQAAPVQATPPVQLPPAPDKLPQIPPPEQLVTLVRSVLLAVNDANLTGNYTVLTALAAPESQRFNTPENLASSFAPIREQKTDFSIVAVATPEFRQLPAFTPKGLLRVNGEFITDPRITFDLFFQTVEGRWRPYAIGIGVVPVPPEPPKPPAPPVQAAKPTPPRKPAAQAVAKPKPDPRPAPAQ